MDKIVLQPSPTTPKVNFDSQTGLLEISGKSLPENSIDFFQPIHAWLDNYSADPNDVTSLIFKLEYFNTSSTSHFLKIIKKVEKLFDMGKNANVIWYYDYEDEDMKEAGEDFKMLVKLPVDIVGTDFISS
jgi:hypothetical protein